MWPKADFEVHRRIWGVRRREDLSLPAFVEYYLNKIPDMGNGEARILSTGTAAFERMYGRLYPKGGDTQEDVEYMAQYRFGSQLPIAVSIIGAFFLILAMILPVFEEAGDTAFLFMITFPPLILLSVLNMLVSGKYCLSLEKDAVLLCRIRPWKITRKRIAKADTRSVFYTRTPCGRGRYQNELFRLYAHLNDDTVTELCLLSRPVTGIAVWLGAIAAWWLGVAFEKRDEDWVRRRKAMGVRHAAEDTH